MKRLLLGLVAAAMLASLSSLAGVAGAVPSAVPTAKPMLGTSRYPGAVGFGQVKPTRLGFGKQVMVCRIHWDSWGGQIALGTGVGSRVDPTTYKHIPSAVVVYLFKLKTIQGKPAYTGLNFGPVPTQHAHPIKAC
jgi:hypothetical protein